MGKQIEHPVGFLRRLAKSQAGNTLALVAAGLIPMLGLIGGGVDMSRLYLTKARLQQACDAGALAGRKQMGAGAWTADSSKADRVAKELFDANFGTDPYGTSGTTRSFVESGGKVTGTASVVVPMTVMRVFGFTQKSIDITCDAEMRIPNTDVMFVLDTTGSMNEIIPSDSIRKIDGLKKAVKCFYEALMKVDTTADCGSAPSGSNGNTVQLRFGFVPYSVNVNVGKILHNDWVANNWTYQSRVFTGTAGTWSDWYNIGATLFVNCPADTGTKQYRNRTQQWYGCTAGQTRDLVGGAIQYTYRPVSLNVSGLKAGGNSWNNSTLLPIGINGANISVNWEGCIEERQTVRTTNFNPIPSNAFDLDIDRVPNVADPATQWGPMLPDAIWGRRTGGNSGNNSYANVVTSTDVTDRNINPSCPPTPAKKMQTWHTAASFETYVNSLTPTSQTYHDIGLIWGARLMSPTGIFANENAFTPTGGQIERHLIFMTDGTTVTNTQNYTAYGAAWWDRRQTPINTPPTDGNGGTLTEQVNLRVSALCSAIKNRNITLWVIFYGAVGSEDSTRLTNCASSGRYFNAENSTQLIEKFKSIADEISQLRLTK